MGGWVQTLIANIGPISTVAGGLIKIGLAVADELKGGNDNATQELEDAAFDVAHALLANTPHAPTS